MKRGGIIDFVNFQEMHEESRANSKISLKHGKIFDALMKIAKPRKELIFQKNEDYIKFKAQKDIKLGDIDYILTRLYDLQYFQESIYWSKRIVDEKLYLKDCSQLHFYNLIYLYDVGKEYAFILEYGQKAQVECGFPLLYEIDNTIFDTLGEAAKKLKRYKEASKYFKERIRYGK